MTALRDPLAPEPPHLAPLLSRHEHGHSTMTSNRNHRNLFHATLGLAMCFTVVGCAEDSMPDDELEDRWYEGYEDLSIHLGPTADDPDDDIWDLLGSGVQGGPASSTPGELIIQLDGWTILDADGELQCEYTWDGVLHLVDVHTGEVVLSNSQIHTIVGDWHHNSGEPNWVAADYTVRGFNVREGGWWGNKLLSTTKHIGWTNGKRQLLIGALIEGVCGAPGLDAVPEAPDDDNDNEPTLPPLPTEG